LAKKRRTYLSASWREELTAAWKLPNRLRVGFGPIVTKENTLGVRKWHIEPVVNYLNRQDTPYSCDVFFRKEDLRLFGLVVVVRDFDHFTPRAMRRLKRRGTRVIYKVADNPASCRRSYLEDTDFLPVVDGIIAANPLQVEDLARHGRPVRLIGAPILSSLHKQNYAAKGPIKILWQGHAENLAFHETLLPLIKRVAEAAGRPVRLLCHTRLKEGTTLPPEAEYLPWTMENAFSALLEADIAVSIKPSDHPLQQRKPATKIMTYMAGGLPVVCAPSQADRLLIEPGRTGFFAEGEEEWRACLVKLVKDAALRETVGRAARASVVERFSIEKVAQAHQDFFDEVVGNAGAAPDARRGTL